MNITDDERDILQAALKHFAGSMLPEQVAVITETLMTGRKMHRPHLYMGHGSDLWRPFNRHFLRGNASHLGELIPFLAVLEYFMHPNLYKSQYRSAGYAMMDARRMLTELLNPHETEP